MPADPQSQRRQNAVILFLRRHQLTLSQDRRKGGLPTLMDHACAAACSQTASRIHSISLKTIPPCPAGSRAWRSLFGSVVCGPREETFSPSVLLAAPLTALTAVAGVFSFLQPDCVSQKPQLQELIESRSHLCDFYPKYHCELNFIKQYWGAAKLRFCMAGRAATIDEMEKKGHPMLSITFPSFFTFVGESSAFLF